MGGDQPTGASAELQQIEKEFQREVAITQARPILHKVLFILWIIFDIALVGLLILVTVGYLISGQWSDRASTASLMQNLGSIHSSALDNAASSLFVDEVVTLRSGDAYDFYVEIQNPNEDWYATFDYAFTSRGEETEEQHGFIFPGETRILIALNQEFENTPSGVEVSVSDLSWERMDAHKVEDIVAWYNDHNDFAVTDASHGTVEVGETSVVRSSFTITNNSPYSYWSAPFILVLERNGVPVGVNQVTVAGFETGETREIDVNWFDNTPSTGDLVVQTAIDFFDDDVYMAERSEAELDVRDIEYR